MIRYDVEFCHKDLYSGFYYTKNTEEFKGDFLPKIGEIVEFRGSNYEVFEVVHKFIEKTGYMNSIVRVK